MIINEDFFDKEEYERLCEECSLKMKFEKIDLAEERESYVRLDCVDYGLPVDVFADEMNTHTYYKHEPIVFFRNSYNGHEHDYLPILVTKNPYVIFDENIKINKKDVLLILRWVERYRDWIVAMAEERITHIYFIKNVAKNVSDNPIISSLTESINLSFPIYEMSKLTKDFSGLENDIWLDDAELYKLGGHALRFKVCPNRKSDIDKNNTNTWVPFIMHNSKFLQGYENLFSKNEYEGLCLFNDVNYNLLKQLADKEISFKEFLKKMRKVYKVSGSKWRAEDKKTTEPNYEYVGNIGNYVMVYLFGDGYNLLNPNGNLMSDMWFAYIDYKLYSDKNGRYFKCTTSEGKQYKLYTNNRLVLIINN